MIPIPYPQIIIDKRKERHSSAHFYEHRTEASTWESVLNPNVSFPFQSWTAWTLEGNYTESISNCILHNFWQQVNCFFVKTAPVRMGARGDVLMEHRQMNQTAPWNNSWRHSPTKSLTHKHIHTHVHTSAFAIRLKITGRWNNFQVSVRLGLFGTNN